MVHIIIYHHTRVLFLGANWEVLEGTCTLKYLCSVPSVLLNIVTPLP